MIPEAVRAIVRQRSGNRCEYCGLLQVDSVFAHHVEHIIARQHLAANDLDNLALACQYCNRKKGPNIAGIDPLTGELVALFHPRRDHWHNHFRWNGPFIEGISPAGRATVVVLALNDRKRIRLRLELLEGGGAV